MKSGLSKLCSAAVAAGLVASLGAMAPVAAIADDLVASDSVMETTADPAASESTQTQDELSIGNATASNATLTDAVPEDATGASAAAPVAESVGPTSSDASAKAPDAKSVAEFNGTAYATFDEALAAASNADGATIKLLADAQTSGLNLNKDLTIDGGGHALAFIDKGIALWGHALTLKNVNATMAGIGSTPYTAEWNWMSVCASKDASLTLDGATLTMDGSGAASKTHAVYFCSNNKLNLKNASKLTIKNYGQDALEWDGGDGGYNVNIEGGSTYTSDHNRSGFVGTFCVTVDSSTVNVANSLGNGSNGSHFDIKNGSTVDFSGNGSHGLSAGNLSISDSKVTAKNNGMTGIIFSGKGEFKGADVQIEGTRGTSYWNAGMRLMKKNATLDVDAASKVSIAGNKVTGLFLDSGARATFAEGASLTITGNDASAENAKSKQELAQMGGGAVVRSGASLTLPSSAVVDNNNAALAGDDLYVEDGGSIAFGATRDDALTEFGNCGHAIDGWYDDAAGSRWSAHGTEKHVEAVAAGSYEAPLALKAAHGLARVDYRYVGEAPSAAQLPGPDEGLEVGLPYNAKAQAGVDGWTFDGWYTDEACTSKWEDGGALAGSMTLYGKWSKVPAAPAEPTEPTTPAQPQDGQDAAAPQKQAKKSKARIPQTGDDSAAAALPAALLGAAAVAAAGVAERLRRRS